MIFRRFFIRLFRFALSLGALWVILAVLWLALPSPAPGPGYPTSRLNNGKTVTRVFKIEDFYSYTDNIQSVKDARRTGRWYMSLDFALVRDADVGRSSLDIGYAGDPLHKYFNSGDDTSFPHHSFPLDFTEGDDKVMVSEPVQLSARTGDTDGINLPWFGVADSALLFWWIHHDVATTTVRARSVPAEKKIEIWPDASFWYSSQHPGGEQTPSDLVPFVTVRLLEDADPVFEFPTLPKSTSPSVFYEARVAVLALLVPVSIMFLAVFYFVTGLMSGLFRILISITTLLVQLVLIGIGCALLYAFVWWFRNGRPSIPFNEISQAVSTVINNARNQQAQPAAAEETGLIDLESGVRQPEGPTTETEVLVDVSSPPKGPTSTTT